MSLITKIIEIAGALMPGSLNTPLDARSRVEKAEDIYAIQNPAEGARVYVESEKRFYFINGLKAKRIGAISVEEAAVASFELVPTIGMIQTINGTLTAQEEFNADVTENLESLHASVDAQGVVNTGIALKHAEYDGMFLEQVEFNADVCADLSGIRDELVLKGNIKDINGIVPDENGHMTLKLIPGFDNIIHADRLFVAGIHNIAGGMDIGITAYNAVTGILTLAAETELLKAGMEVQIHTTYGDDNSPYAATIAAVDGVSVTLAEALTLGPIEEGSCLIMPIMDESDASDASETSDLSEFWADDESNVTIGDFNINTGMGAVVVGSVNVNTADYAFVSGSCNYNSGLGATVSGTGNFNTGEHADIAGVSNKVTGGPGYGRYVFIRGNGNTAGNDSITIIGSGNEVTGMGATVIGNMNKEVTGREAFALGNALKVLADYAKAFGYQLKVAAKNAFMFGRYGELDASAENEGAIAFAGGEHGKPLLAWIFRTRKAVLNPLYNPSLDAAKTGTDSKGERQYIPKLAFSAQFRGRLTGTTATLTSSTNYVTLDHDHYNRWKFTPTRATIPVPENWNDNDSGELIIYNGGSYIQWPADWVWIGKAPALGTVNSFSLWKTDGIMYIKDMLSAGVTDSDISALNYLKSGDAAVLYAPISHSNNADIHVTAAQKTSWTNHVADTTSHVTVNDKSGWNTHVANNDIHVTTADKTKWNGYNTVFAPIAHVSDTIIHITAAERTAWNGKAAGDHTHGDMVGSEHDHDTLYAPISHSNNADIHVTAAQKTSWTNHAADTTIHVTSSDKSGWNTHVADTVKHVTAADKTKWDGYNTVFAPLAHTSDTVIHVTSSDKSGWNTHVANNDIHVTAADKTKWNNYKKIEWTTLTFSGTMQLSPVNGENQKVTLGGHVNILAPVLSSTSPVLLLQITRNGYDIYLEGRLVEVDAAIVRIAWDFDGENTIGYNLTPVEVYHASI